MFFFTVISVITILQIIFILDENVITFISYNNKVHVVEILVNDFHIFIQEGGKCFGVRVKEGWLNILVS